MESNEDLISNTPTANQEVSSQKKDIALKGNSRIALILFFIMNLLLLGLLVVLYNENQKLNYEILILKTDNNETVDDTQDGSTNPGSTNDLAHRKASDSDGIYSDDSKNYSNDGISTRAFEVTISSMENIRAQEDEYYFLAQYLGALLNINYDSYEEWPYLAYDVTKPSVESDKANDDTYVIYLKMDERVDTTKPYYDEANDITVTFKPLDKSTEPYIADPDYCEKKEDCVLRTNFCNYGAFNKYHGFAEVWGCGGLSDDDGKFVSTYDKQNDCYNDVEYGDYDCINNSCVALDKNIFCVKKDF